MRSHNKNRITNHRTEKIRERRCRRREEKKEYREINDIYHINVEMYKLRDIETVNVGMK